MKKLMIIIISAAVLLSGCGGETGTEADTDTEAETETETEERPVTTQYDI